MKAYWYQNKKYPNLGDEFTGLLLKRKYGINAEWSEFAQSELAATGSILGSPWAGLDKGRKQTLHVVGSGLMTPATRIIPKENLRIHSVRGFLSKEKLGVLDDEGIDVGDPGLLVPEVAIAKEVSRRSEIGVILHHTSVGNDALKKKFAHLPVTFLDIRTLDIDSFVAQMRECDVILSQSLHGLIFADALGIPNAWLVLNRIHTGGHFKFYDYFSSVGRNFYQRVTGVPRTKKAINEAVVFPDSDRISEVAEGINSSFLQAFDEIEKGRKPIEELSMGDPSTPSEISLNVNSESRNIRFDFSAELDDRIKFRDVLISLDLVDRDGNEVKGARKIEGLTWSNSARVNHYRYIRVVPGSWTYSEEFHLPSDVRCTRAKVLIWANPDRSAVFKNLVLRNVSV
ncbi:polysaccharide pyruvyl transferase family protein [Corynebacterium halotolerans]|uniref:polysaccharide pyruvyl transferase family protein n=1 Tax=Corynebacterium halotolerans TaxID=225326 RepID=UPI000B081ACF|nr:polysaccharide pyruvyl transferase family protein [Corynebacterium halotolerans]